MCVERSWYKSTAAAIAEKPDVKADELASA